MTTSTAMEAGWAWNIPLQTRVGTGYVFSSAFKKDDDAVEEFQEFLGPIGRKTEPRILKMRIGHTRRSWVKNCVAIGLSSGFIEPLESTAIMSVELQIRWLLYDLPTTDFEQPLLDHFNGATQRLYEEICDFLGMHFKLSNRADTPYWKAIQNEVKASDSLEEHFKTWSCAMPNPIDPRIRTVFNQWSIACILMGKNFYKDKTLGGSEVVTPPMWQTYCNEVLTRKKTVLKRIANHQELVDTMLAKVKPGESAARKVESTEPLIGDTGNLDIENRPVMSPPPAGR
ncbi:MAG: tryptophan 7-halogenase [Micropepsaceae bacterium]